ncbi:MAG: hypothetical protein KGH55_00835 [Nanoarchaeota archaeon]|nr:hypothetical protein [Nanoarchaeota archaeon]
MKISSEKQDKISEQILSFLFYNSPKPFFTSHLAKEVVRDEEFIKGILENLRKKGLVLGITKNARGIAYKKRIRWKLTDEAYGAYKNSTLK